MYAGIPGRRLPSVYAPDAAGVRLGPGARPAAAYGTVVGVVTRPLPGDDPRRPGLVPVPRRPRAGAVRGQGQVAAQPPGNLLRRPGHPAARGPPRWWRQADHVEWIQVGNEVEAILLEYTLIKQHRPRFNIRLNDDKSYPSLAVTLADEWPRAGGGPGRRRPGVRYFGPYAARGAIRDTLDLLLRTFPVRTCSDRKLDRHTKLGKPCLLFHIERCSGPCIGAVDHDRYDRHGGRPHGVSRRRHRRRRTPPRARRWRRPPRRSTSSGPPALRDRSATLRMAVERQQVVTERPEDLDVVGVDEDPLEAAVCVFHVRRGRIVGRRAFVVDKVEDLTPAPAGGPGPRELYGDAEPGRRARWPGRGRTLGLDLGRGDPSRGAEGRRPGSPAGARADLPETPRSRRSWPAAGRRWRCGSRRAASGPAADRRRATPARSSPATGCAAPRTTTAGPGPSSRSARCSGLAQAPLRIECYDMSHLQGTDYVGSMVVSRTGCPGSREYRRFRVRDRARQRRLRGHGGGAHPPAQRPARGAGRDPGRADGQASARGRPGDASPIRPSCSSSTGARASWAWASGCSSAWD